MQDTSSKHGTNANYKKSGAPGLLGKIMDPLGIMGKAKGLLGGKGKPCPPAQGAQQAAAPAPDAPAQPAAPAPAAAAPAVPEEAAAPMKDKFKVGGKGQGAGDGKKKISKGKDLDKMPGGMGGDEFTYLPPGTKKKGAPMAQRPPKSRKPKPRKPSPSPEPRPRPKKKTAKDFDKIIGKNKMGAPMKKPGAPHTKYFGQNTTIDEVSAVSKHNRAHKSGKYDKNHQAKEGKGKYVLRPDALDKETNTGFVKADNEQKKEKKKKRDVNTAINKMTNINYKK